MTELLLALIFAVVALWLALFQSRAWERRRRVAQRLVNPAKVDEPQQVGIIPGISSRLTSSAFMRDDYREMYSALRLTGKSAEQIQQRYLLICWGTPLAALLIGVSFFGVFGALLLLAGGFILPRRYIRGVGDRAKRRQNLEAIELAQVLRMLLEAGLSIERGFRIAAIQARPLVPTLAYRLDRFNRLMDSGADRGAALDDIGEGKDIPVLHNLTRLLKQAGALGGGITASIEQIIKEGNEIERSRIKEKVNKIAAKMTVVMMVIMLPALFLIIGGPAGISIFDALSR